MSSLEAGKLQETQVPQYFVILWQTPSKLLTVPGWGICSHQDPASQAQSWLRVLLLILLLCLYDLCALLAIASLFIWFGGFPALQSQPLSTEGPGRPPGVATNCWTSVQAITCRLKHNSLELLSGYGSASCPPLREVSLSLLRERSLPPSTVRLRIWASGQPSDLFLPQGSACVSALTRLLFLLPEGESVPVNERLCLLCPVSKWKIIWVWPNLWPNHLWSEGIGCGLEQLLWEEGWLGEVSYPGTSQVPFLALHVWIKHDSLQSTFTYTMLFSCLIFWFYKHLLKCPIPSTRVNNTVLDPMSNMNMLSSRQFYQGEWSGLIHEQGRWYKFTDGESREAVHIEKDIIWIWEWREPVSKLILCLDHLHTSKKSGGWQ